MDPRQFDSLILQNQGFNTLNNVVHSNVVQNMAEQTLQSVHAMQGMQITQPKESAYNPAGLYGVNPQHQPLQPNTSQHQFLAVVNGAQKGPFTLEQLKGLAIADVISEDTLVWMQGMPEWVSLRVCLANLK
ncbi:MAG: DUF4339 domain-containing protein [Bacteroidales bacterium]|nr:DUF4339 domain-containing protein [Bacteroidales bacterium]